MPRLDGAVVLVLMLALAATPVTHADERVVTLVPRAGVTLDLLVIAPRATPRASVVLLPGGEGVLELSPGGVGRGGNNFLVRSRAQFADQGLVVAVADAASDFKPRSDGLRGRRAGREHAADLAAIIAHLRGHYSVPVWLIGNSRGTESAVNAAARLQKDGPDGIVLAASVTDAAGRQTETVYDSDLGAIRVPVLLLHHRRDACEASPPAGAERLAKRFKRAARTELKWFVDGRDEVANPCQALTHHGFFGIEDEVVGAIGAWIGAPR